jgi:ComF family protein
MSLAADLVDLFLSSKCLLCNRLPKQLCDECLIAMPFEVRHVSRNDLSGQSIGEYRDQLATTIKAFKERGQRSIGALLGREMAKRLVRPQAELLMAAPSSARRGYVPAEVIAQALSKSWSIPVARLRIKPGGQDQSRLPRIDRLVNLTNRVWSPLPLGNKRILMVDDVVTTGATLAEMARAVRAAGGEPIGFVTVAETLPKSHTNF